jgi:hypothetical protein
MTDPQRNGHNALRIYDSCPYCNTLRAGYAEVENFALQFESIAPGTDGGVTKDILILCRAANGARLMVSVPIEEIRRVLG